jgi:hypothetical protein
MPRILPGFMLAGMELTGAERAVVWVSLLLAAGVLLVSVDLLTGGRLFGWSPMPAASVTEAAADE